MIEEKLKILAAGSPGVEPTIRGTAGAQFTAEDAAHALSYCKDRIGALVLAVRVADQRLMLPDLRREWAWRALAIAQDRDRAWCAVTDDAARTVLTLARLALDDLLTPRLCKRCRGRGEIKQRRTKVVACPACAGSGLPRRAESPWERAAEERRLAARASIALRDWRQTWARRYDVLLGALENHARVAEGQLARALRRSDGY